MKLHSSVVSVLILVVAFLPVVSTGTDLYRGVTPGTWDDANWVDSGSGPQSEPTATDDAYIGGSGSPLTPAAVSVIAAGEVVSNLYIGRPGAAAGDTGSLTISNNADLTVHGSVHFGDQQAPASSFTMVTNGGASLTVNNDFFIYHGTVTWQGMVGVSNEVRVGHYESPSYSDYGKLILDGATATVAGRLTMAYSTLSYGDLTLTNGSTLTIGEDFRVCTAYNIHGGTLTVGPDCKLIVAGDFFVLDDDNDITIQNPNTNKFQIGGSLMMPASRGNPDIIVDGGRLLVDSILMPPDVTGYGRDVKLYLNNGATVSVRRAAADVTSHVGSSSHFADYAWLYIGDASQPGQIDIFETGDTGKHNLEINTVVDYSAGATKSTIIVDGWGRVELDGTLENNGKVIANGYGTDRDLIMTNFTAVSQDDTHYHLVYDNFYMGDNDHVGWYASDHGRLVLPPLTGLTANATVRWGDDLGDTTTFNSNDLVNSLLLDFNNCVGGDVWVSLLATNRTDHDATNLSVLGIWDIDGSGFNFGGSGTVALKFRFDEALAAEKLLDESGMKAWQYTGGNWVDVTAQADGTNHIVTTTALSAFSKFAVSSYKPDTAAGPVLPQTLYRTNAVGEWDDGTWVKTGGTPAPDPTAIDDAYIGGDDGVGVADSTVIIDGLSASVSNLYVGLDSDSVDDGESGKLVLTNGASLQLRDLGIGGLSAPGKYSHGEIAMDDGTTLTVDGDLGLNNSSWTINSNHTVTLGGKVTLNNMSAYTPNPTARLTCEGGTNTIAGDLTLSTYYFQNTYLTLTNGATLNVGGDLWTYIAQGSGLYQYLNIYEGSVLNIAGDFNWRGNSAMVSIPGDGVMIGGSLKVGSSATTAKLAIDGGQLVVDSLLVPNAGSYASQPDFRILNNATVSVRRADSEVNSWIGMSSHINGNADFYLGDATAPGTIDVYETGETGKCSLTVLRESSWASTGIGTFFLRGWGRVDLDGTLENNGSIIADGYGSDRDLVMTNFTEVTQNEAATHGVAFNFMQADGTKCGWHAVNGGKLRLPPLTNLTGNATVRWGDTIDDLTLTSNDLVNSAMLNFTGCTGGDISGSIMATNRADDDVLYPESVVGIWEFDGSAYTFGGGNVQVTLRYDDILRNAKSITEADLKVWKFPGFGNSPYWEDVTGSLNTDSNLISTKSLGSLSQFAVSTAAPGDEPPPGTMIIMR